MFYKMKAEMIEKTTDFREILNELADVCTEYAKTSCILRDEKNGIHYAFDEKYDLKELEEKLKNLEIKMDTMIDFIPCDYMDEIPKEERTKKLKQFAIQIILTEINKFSLEKQLKILELNRADSFKQFEQLEDYKVD